jgi:hypothetical protein
MCTVTFTEVDRPIPEHRAGSVRRLEDDDVVTSTTLTIDADGEEKSSDDPE